MIAIAAIDENWGIGKDNRLLFSIPDDMMFFRETTNGHTVVMGRKTLESFPGGKPLKNRRNIVLTTNPDYHPEGAKTVHTVDDLLEQLKGLPEDEVYVIGGASVYRVLIPYCDKCYITKMYRYFEADTYFPNLDSDPGWKVAESGEMRKYEDLDYQFLTYLRRI